MPKRIIPGRVWVVLMTANPEYDAVYESFEWEDALETYDWDAPAELNVAHEACDRHAGSGDVGFAWVDPDGDLAEYTFGELQERSNRVANALEALGVERGDRVTTLLPKVPETIVTILGIWKTGAVHVPLFTAFETGAVEYRVEDAEPEVLVYHADHADTVATVDTTGLTTVSVGEDSAADHEYGAAVADRAPEYEVTRTAMADPCTMQYTSGTTGPPKGVVLPHKVLPVLYPHTKYVLDIRPDDVVWGAADPSWSFGLFTTGFGPMAFGATRVLHAGQFDPDRWVGILADHDISVLGAAPSAYRGIIADGEELLEGRSFEGLRVLHSAGEPLNPEVVDWFRDQFGLTVHDGYGLTEGGMVVNNYAGLDTEVKPGSMGLPCPGYEVTLLDPETREPVAQGETGEIAVKPRDWLLMDRYWGLPERTERTFEEGWLLTDDLAHRDTDGYYWYEGRGDDVIISSGYRIGPFEVENSLIEQSIVAEAAVIGLPDDQRGQRVKAFVVPTEQPADPDAAAERLKQHVKEQQARHAYPREVEFVDELPKTATGKIQRYKLEERDADASRGSN